MKYRANISPSKFYIHLKKNGKKEKDLPKDPRFPDCDNTLWQYDGVKYHVQEEDFEDFVAVHFVKKVS